MFLHNWWYVAAWVHQVQPGEIAARTILGEPLILFRTASGTVVALEDRCCHRFAPLSRGRLEGDAIRCMYHGLKFAASGQCIEMPAQDTIPSEVKVRTYPVVEKDQWIWVWMGDAACADITLIPDAIGHEGSEYTLATGELRYNANYQLVHDNLLDLTHLSYVHQNTFGHNRPNWGRVRSMVTQIERGVRAQRWLTNQPVAAFLPAAPGTRRDNWATADLVVPGVFRLSTESYPMGTAQKFPSGPVGLEPEWVVVTSNAVTPINERSTLYYYSCGQLSRHADDALIQQQAKVFSTAFLEDKGMLEAQQRSVDAAPDRMMMTLTFDRSIAMFRRIVANLADAETTPAHGGGDCHVVAAAAAAP